MKTDTETTHYHADGHGNLWKFEPGKPPMHRFDDENQWEESSFTSYEEFSQAPGDTYETTADHAEP